MMEKQEDLLPEDVLVEVLRHLAPRCLATSRCICKAWRTIIDAHRLLRADLLPHSVGGIFINFHDLLLSEFFSRPSTGPTVSGNFDYLPCTSNIVRDHCNGLLLLYDYVVNPATRRWAQLPPQPSPLKGMEFFHDDAYLVFDPTVSPHYEVFLIPRVYTMLHGDDKLEPTLEESEWPPSPCILHVFSSRRKRWEERSFVREGEAAGTIADMRLAERNVQRYAVYWRGALYVHCQTEFVMRISLSNDKYQVIKPPIDFERSEPNFHLGRSEKGVYCELDDRVWILNESFGQMEWVSTHRIGWPRGAWQQIDGPWILQDVNYAEYCKYEDHDEDDNNEAIVERKFEWDSDNDNFIDYEGMANKHVDITFLGFHPFKEVVFLNETLRRGLAYHLNSSKIQDLGNLCPKLYTQIAGQPFVEAAFIYTPCWMGDFPENN